MDITIGQTIDFTILIGSLILAVGTILGAVSNLIDNQFEKRCKPMCDQIESVKESLADLKRVVDWNDIDVVRSRISAFENLVRLDVNHNQLKRHQYITAIKDIDKWKEYHRVYKDLNGEMDMAIDDIKEAYKKAKFDD